MAPVVLSLLTLGAAASAADLKSACVAGCESVQDDSPGLLYHPEDQPVTIRWWSKERPPDGLELLAGDPMASAALPSRGTLAFVEQGGMWSAEVEFSSAELGRGTFLTVLRRDPLLGTAELVEWKVWRVLTPRERAEQVAPPAPREGWTIAAHPEALRLRAGDRTLPRGVNSRSEPWWAPPDDQPWNDLDLDGPVNGAPGVTVTVSPVWEGRAERSGWMERLAELDGADDRAYGELQWRELPERDLGSGWVQRPFYVAVMVVTDASVAGLSRQDVSRRAGRCDGACLAHETSANIPTADDLRLWAGYNPYELSQDPDLLALVQRALRRKEAVPGLPTVPEVSGDGGPTRVDLGLAVQLVGAPGAPSQGGIVAVNLVGVRTGCSALQGTGRESLPALPRLMASLVGTSGSHDVDPADLPEGWSVSAPLATSQSAVGALRMLDPWRLAQKGAEPSLPDWEQATDADPSTVTARPRLARVALSAELRAGAAVQRDGLQRATALLPLNAFAEYVLEIVVAEPAAEAEITMRDPLPPDPPPTSSHPTPRKDAPAAVSAVTRAAWVGAGLVGLGLLAYALAQVRGLVDAVFGRRRGP